MIKFDKVSYSFPQKDLYTDVSFTIEEGQHCAFIGASGSGKSTLIDIIMDPEKYVFDGNVEMEPSLKIGYVSQFSQRDKETTVFEYIAEEFIKLENEIATYNADASRGRALKARVKIQERLEANRIKHPFVDIKQPYINLETNNEIEEEIIALKTDNLGISFDEVLLQNVNFEIKSNDKVAIIGTNGVGKTTLLKQIFKNNNDAIKIDENIKLAYLSQMQSEVVNESNTILQEFYDVGFETYGEIRRYLGRYGFSSDILTQKIESLSGGEKNILQLAKVSASKANMLLMDEPTSHLDIYSQMALEKAISNYKGAILMISHDYHFIVNCADYVLLIEDKTIRKMSMRKFRKMIYANHFDKDYLQIEEKKKALEMDIASSLRDTDFERARSLSEKLEEIIKSL